MIDREEALERLATIAQERGWHVVTAESLTNGQIASTLGSGPDASEWFAGGLVAYATKVKHRLLGVEEEKVVSAACAEQMATGACSLLDAQVAVSATGVGGPGPSEGEPAGTVFVSVAAPGDLATRKLALDGDPEQVLAQTVDHALDLLLQVLQGEGR